ncbi:MAG: S1/P1 nuclease [Salibacteraceae bacterium]
MKNYFSVSIIIALIGIPVVGFSWGATGHRVVGQVAMNHMTKKANKNVLAALGSEDVAMVSNWMDFIKSESDKRHMNAWHYCTVPDSGHYEGAPEEGDVNKMINQFVEELKTKNFSVDEAFALKSLIHLVGDVHQPLHVGNGTDRGGNDVKLKFFYSKSNLHRVWDSGMIDKQQLSYSEYAKWIDVTSADEVEKWQSATVMNWMEESVSYRESIYDIPEDKNLSYKYVHDHIHEVNLRLLQAGVRLAGILNEIYG